MPVYRFKRHDNQLVKWCTKVFSHPSKNARKIAKSQKFCKPSKIEENLTSGKQLVFKKLIRSLFKLGI